MLTDSYVTVAQAVNSILVANRTTLGLQDVFYGDQNRIPRTPAACVEPGGKSRTLNGMPRRTDLTLTAYVLVYHFRLATAEAVRLENDTLAEDIEAFLHIDAQLKDTEGEAVVIDSMVTSIESGYQMKANSLFRASRLTFEARSQIQLPYST